MKWVKESHFIRKGRVSIKSWCHEVEPGAMKQAESLAAHPAIDFHIALMPDCHQGYGMPIGGVVACQDAIIPNAVGVDIGCGMGAIETDVQLPQEPRHREKLLRKIITRIKREVPLGDGNSHSDPQHWEGFESFRDQLDSELPGWMTTHTWDLAQRSLGTLGGGNHFIELQEDENGTFWASLHSGSRNLGYKISTWHHHNAIAFCAEHGIETPTPDLAWFPTDSEEGQAYIRDMDFASEFAAENRKRMMDVVRDSISRVFPQASFNREINIHHNYATQETHFGEEVWVHRKGATRAVEGELGLIPGSMGTPSYIVEGLGHPESFNSCSHGAGRVMGRREASRRLNVKECNEAMKGILFDGWRKKGGKRGEPLYDLGEAPQAYKDIEEVIEFQQDLVKPRVKLTPLAVLKG